MISLQTIQSETAAMIPPGGLLPLVWAESLDMTEAVAHAPRGHYAARLAPSGRWEAIYIATDGDTSRISEEASEELAQESCSIDRLCCCDGNVWYPMGIDREHLRLS